MNRREKYENAHSVAFFRMQALIFNVFAMLFPKNQQYTLKILTF